MMVGKFLVGLTACVLLSCGGSSSSSSGNGTCGAVAACGGNLAGTWTASSACVSNGAQTVMMMGCSATATVTPQLSGSLTFTSGGTYSGSVSVTDTTTVTIPASCLSFDAGILSGTLTCAELQAEVALSAQGQTAACVSASGGGCTCTLTPPTSTSTASGTYTTSGSVATLTDTDVDSGTSLPSMSSYCVSGSYLHVLTSSGGGDAGTTTVDLVFKQ